MTELFTDLETAILHTAEVDYSKILGNNEIVFAGEYHSNTAIKLHLATQAEELRAAGFTHFAIELPSTINEKLKKLERGEQVDQILAEDDSDYELMIQAMIRSGIIVRAIDITEQDYKTYTKEQREKAMTGNIARILITNHDAKILCLVGVLHAVTKFNRDGVPSVRKRFVDAGVPTATLFFHGGRKSELDLLFGESHFDKVVRQSDKVAVEWMIDNRKNKITNFDREADWIVHLPPS